MNIEIVSQRSSGRSGRSFILFYDLLVLCVPFVCCPRKALCNFYVTSFFLQMVIHNNINNMHYLMNVNVWEQIIA